MKGGTTIGKERKKERGGDRYFAIYIITTYLWIGSRYPAGNPGLLESNLPHEQGVK